MRLYVSLGLGWLFIGCATPAAYFPTVVSERRVEEQALPPDPASEALPPGTPPEEWVEPAEKGSTLTKSGILVSEARAVRDAQYRIRYSELRRNYEADRMVWRAHRELYEERLKAADEKLRKLEPGWWERHAFQVGVVGGFLIGAGMTVALAFVTNAASK